MSASLTSLIAEVYTLTNRPDLISETLSAVKAATLKAHQVDDWIKDLAEYSIQFNIPDYYQSLDYKAVIPLWRKPRYIRKYETNPVTGISAPSLILQYIEPEKVVDSYKLDRLDVFYVAGSNIQIRSSTLLQNLLVGAYINPTLTTSDYSSWIANDHPYAIIYEAVAIVYKTIGYDEQVSIYRVMVGEQLQMLKQHATTGIGM